MVQKVEKKKRHKRKTIEKRVLEKSQMPENIEFEYVGADVVSENDPNFQEFQTIFQKFLKPEELLNPKTEEKEEIKEEEEKEFDPMDKYKENENLQLSKKKLKQMKQFSVAQLKSMVEKPDVVEVHDVTSKDPKFLIFLKSYRGTIPVPRHW
jgi:splicing factor 3B subunit 2